MKHALADLDSEGDDAQKKEFEEKYKPMIEANFPKADADGNGKLNKRSGKLSL